MCLECGRHICSGACPNAPDDKPMYCPICCAELEGDTEVYITVDDDEIIGCENCLKKRFYKNVRN